jgi:hypothetical protein
MQCFNIEFWLVWASAFFSSWGSPWLWVPRGGPNVVNFRPFSIVRPSLFPAPLRFTQSAVLIRPAPGGASGEAPWGIEGFGPVLARSGRGAGESCIDSRGSFTGVREINTHRNPMNSYGLGP